MAGNGDMIDEILEEILPEGTEISEKHSSEEAFTNAEKPSSDDQSAQSEDTNDLESNFILEYMRFQNPTYHLTYSGVEKTFCGRNLSGLDYKTTTNKPELLNPCERCQSVNNRLSEDEQIIQIRENIGDIVDEISESPEDPVYFTKEELKGLAAHIPTEIENEGELSDLRRQLSLAVDGINAPVDEPGQFTLSELEAVDQALQGEGLIPLKNHIYLFTNDGFIKKMEVDEFQKQKRGGKGKYGFKPENLGNIECLLITDPRKTLFLISSSGNIHELNASEIPEMDLDGRSQISEFLNIDPASTIQAVLSADTLPADRYLIIATKNGYVKRTAARQFTNIQRGGIQAIGLEENDEVRCAAFSDGSMDVILGTKSGRAIRFAESEIRTMGREARGVNGIKLESDDDLVGLVTIDPDSEEELLTITANGYGKRTNLNNYRTQGRNGLGLIDITTEGRNGTAVFYDSVSPSNELFVTSTEGKVIRMEVSDLSLIGRNTRGAAVMEVVGDYTVSSAEKL